MVFEPIIDCNATIIFENVTNLAFISPYTFFSIGDLIRNNFQYEKRIYQFIVNNYYQDIYFILLQVTVVIINIIIQINTMIKIYQII